MPTQMQMLQTIVICQWLSNFYRPIYLFRYDPIEEYIFILAGENETIQVTIQKDGEWEFEENE